MIARRIRLRPPILIAPSGDPSPEPELAPLPGLDLRPLAVDAAGHPSRLLMVRVTHRATGLLRSTIAANAIRDQLAQINWSDSPGAIELPESLRNLPPVPTRWVGPAPRIVRRGTEASAAQETDVAWPLLLEPVAGTTDAQVAAAQQNRKVLIERALAALSEGWSGATITAYTDALNGPLTWWQSGSSARTRTTDRFPAVTEIDAQENPQGPTAADLQNPDYLTWLNQNSPTVSGFSWGLVAGGGLALVGVVALLARFGGGSREVVIRTEGRAARVARPRSRSV